MHCINYIIMYHGSAFRLAEQNLDFLLLKDPGPKSTDVREKPSGKR